MPAHLPDLCGFIRPWRGAYMVPYWWRCWRLRGTFFWRASEMVLTRSASVDGEGEGEGEAGEIRHIVGWPMNKTLVFCTIEVVYFSALRRGVFQYYNIPSCFNTPVAGPR